MPRVAEHSVLIEVVRWCEAASLATTGIVAFAFAFSSLRFTISVLSPGFRIGATFAMSCCVEWHPYWPQTTALQISN